MKVLIKGIMLLGSSFMLLLFMGYCKIAEAFSDVENDN